jgi:hypothetical protein
MAAESVLYGHVESIILGAQEKENNKQWKDAFDGYMNAVKLLLLLIDKEAKEEKKEILRERASTVMDKAESIKKQYLPEMQDKEKAAKSPDQNYVVHFRIEKVRCVKLDSAINSTEVLVEDTLQLLCIDGKYFINIGNVFAYELNETIPCLAMSPGYYVLKGPDDYFFGVVFPDGIPEIYCQKFQEKLAQICIFKTSVTRPSSVEEPSEDTNKQIVVASNSTSGDSNQVTVFHEQNINSMAKKVEIGGSMLSHGISVGAGYISKGIETGAEKLKDYINPAEVAPEIPETIKTTLKIAKQVTPHIVTVTGVLASGIHAVARGVGNLAVDAMKEKVGYNPNKVDDPRVTAAKNLGKAGAVAFLSIWNSLEDAGMTLATTTGKAAVNVIHHKYGDEAGKVASDGLVVATDVMQTSKILNSIGVKGFAKGVVKHSTKTLIGIEGGTVPATKMSIELNEGEFEILNLPSPPNSNVGLLEDGQNVVIVSDIDDTDSKK